MYITIINTNMSRKAMHSSASEFFFFGNKIRIGRTIYMFLNHLYSKSEMYLKNKARTKRYINSYILYMQQALNKEKVERKSVMQR